jgi:hypothetical protein
MRPSYTVEMGRRPSSSILTSNPGNHSAVGAYWMLETELNMILADRERPDRAPQMPLLGLLSGLTLALALWSGIVWLVLNSLN